jgi:hypothetical protein
MPVNLHGTSYQTVQERLEIAHDNEGRPTGIQSISTKWEQFGDNVIAVATITFKDGRVFQGTSSVPFNGRSPAEQGAPWEVAETSAWGRALAAAGYYGSDKGIAGAEELALSVERASFRSANSSPANSAAPRPAALTAGNAPAANRAVMNPGGPATPKQIELLERILPDDMLNAIDFGAMTRGEASELIDMHGNKRGR